MEPSQQFIPWQDHPQTAALYDAEADWTHGHPETHRRIGGDEAVDFLRQASGNRRASLVPRSELPHGVAYIVGGGGYGNRNHLYYSPEILRDTHGIGYLTHEATHMTGVMGHGPNLARAHLQVVHRVLGDSHYKRLQDYYDQYKVKY